MTSAGRMLVAVAVAAAAVAVGTTAALGRVHRAQPDSLVPSDPRGLVVGVPVWYDAKGLHHGDLVEKTPVDIWQLEPPQPNQGVQKGALALVRSGALYLDPRRGDVWFHPWSGQPHIVGRHSAAGPGGDPNGDTAAWFDGSELVVYDTAAGREIARIQEGNAAGATGGGGEHYPTGNGFLQVGAEHISWNSFDMQKGSSTYSHDMGAGRSSPVANTKERYLVDVRDDVEAAGDPRSGDLVVSVPGRADARFSDLETHVRLSPSGNYVLAVEDTKERHGAAIVDARTGQVWRTPEAGYPWIAWSYGDLAVIDVEGHGLLACNPSRRSCEQLAAEGPVLLPTS